MVTAVSAIPPLTGIGLRIAGAHDAPTAAVATWLVEGAFALAMGSCSERRVSHEAPGGWSSEGTAACEAYGTTIAISLYALVMTVFLP